MIFLSLSLCLHPLSSTKLIFTLIVSDYALLYKKAPYQTSSREMEFTSGRAAGDHMFIFYHEDKAMENRVKHFKNS